MIRQINNMLLLIIISYRSLKLLQLSYGRKVWWGENLVSWLFLSIWQKKVWWINRPANRLLFVSTNLDGFSLVDHGQFTKFAKLSPCQVFLLYGISVQCLAIYLHCMTIATYVAKFKMFAITEFGKFWLMKSAILHWFNHQIYHSFICAKISYY